jgi:intein/homing endonuclease
VYKWLGKYTVWEYYINMPSPKLVDRDFFKRWSSQMAYVLGFFAADGNMVKNSRGGHYISFYSSDKDLLLEIKKLMNSGHKFSKRKFENVYRFQIGSTEMFDDLSSLGFTGNKSQRMQFPQIPKKFIRDFIRGYFDGDGNVWAGLINKKRPKPTKILQVAFTSGSVSFLGGLLILLRNEGVDGGSLFGVKNKNCHRLLFSTLDSLKIFEIMYNETCRPYLKRKRFVFEKFIKMRP